MFSLTIGGQGSIPGVDQHTHSPGGRGAHENLTHQLGIRGNVHGNEGVTQLFLLAIEPAPVDLIIDFLKGQRKTVTVVLSLLISLSVFVLSVY